MILFFRASGLKPLSASIMVQSICDQLPSKLESTRRTNRVRFGFTISVIPGFRAGEAEM